MEDALWRLICRQHSLSCTGSVSDMKARYAHFLASSGSAHKTLRTVRTSTKEIPVGGSVYFSDFCAKARLDLRDDVGISDNQFVIARGKHLQKEYVKLHTNVVLPRGPKPRSLPEMVFRLGQKKAGKNGEKTGQKTSKNGENTGQKAAKKTGKNGEKTGQKAAKKTGKKRDKVKKKERQKRRIIRKAGKMLWEKHRLKAKLRAYMTRVVS
jgi:hypothetical protein